MNIFSLFGKPSNSTAKIPTFEPGSDSVDLQIKSFLYIFKRLRINKLSPFLNKNGDTYSLKHVNGNKKNDDSIEIQNYFQKLDAMYNVEHFKLVMINDEYRVTFDFIKNKFRSYCILSNYPSDSLSATTVVPSDKEFPIFQDYKNREIKNYRFSLMPLKNISIEFISNTLTMSDIYIEHHFRIDFDTRYQYAIESIDKVLKFGKTRPSRTNLINITEHDKSLIIRLYLTKMAFNVQLNRIYEEYVKHSSKTPGNSSPVKYNPKGSLTHSSSFSNLLQPSNTKLNNPKTNLSLSPRKSTIDMKRSRSPSPTKSLKSKPSVSKLKMNQLYNSPSPAPSPTPFAVHESMETPRSDTSSNTSLGPDNVIGSPKKLPDIPIELRLDIWDKCKFAINDKLEREREKLSA